MSDYHEGTSGQGSATVETLLSQVGEVLAALDALDDKRDEGPITAIAGFPFTGQYSDTTLLVFGHNERTWPAYQALSALRDLGAEGLRQRFETSTDWVAAMGEQFFATTKPLLDQLDDDIGYLASCDWSSWESESAPEKQQTALAALRRVSDGIYAALDGAASIPCGTPGAGPGPASMVPSAVQAASPPTIEVSQDMLDAIDRFHGFLRAPVLDRAPDVVRAERDAWWATLDATRRELAVAERAGEGATVVAGLSTTVVAAVVSAAVEVHKRAAEIHWAGTSAFWRDLAQYVEQVLYFVGTVVERDVDATDNWQKWNSYWEEQRVVPLAAIDPAAPTIVSDAETRVQQARMTVHSITNALTKVGQWMPDEGASVNVSGLQMFERLTALRQAYVFYKSQDAASAFGAEAGKACEHLAHVVGNVVVNGQWTTKNEQWGRALVKAVGQVLGHLEPIAKLDGEGAQAWAAASALQGDWAIVSTAGDASDDAASADTALGHAVADSAAGTGGTHAARGLDKGKEKLDDSTAGQTQGDVVRPRGRPRADRVTNEVRIAEAHRWFAPLLNAYTSARTAIEQAGLLYQEAFHSWQDAGRLDTHVTNAFGDSRVFTVSEERVREVAETVVNELYHPLLATHRGVSFWTTAWPQMTESGGLPAGLLVKRTKLGLPTPDQAQGVAEGVLALCLAAEGLIHRTRASGGDDVATWRDHFEHWCGSSGIRKAALLYSGAVESPPEQQISHDVLYQLREENQRAIKDLQDGQAITYWVTLGSPDVLVVGDHHHEELRGRGRYAGTITVKKAEFYFKRLVRGRRDDVGSMVVTADNQQVYDAVVGELTATDNPFRTAKTFTWAGVNPAQDASALRDMTIRRGTAAPGNGTSGTSGGGDGEAWVDIDLDDSDDDGGESAVVQSRPPQIQADGIDWLQFELKTTFSRLWNTPAFRTSAALREFHTFLTRQFAAENLDFLVDLTGIEGDPGKAGQVYQTYIAPDEVINVDHTGVEGLRADFARDPASIATSSHWSTVRTEVLDTLTGAWRPFLVMKREEALKGRPG